MSVRKLKGHYGFLGEYDTKSTARRNQGIFRARQYPGKAYRFTIRKSRFGYSLLVRRKKR